MRPIPPKLKKEMENDKFYERCCITGAHKSNTKIEWHHNFIYAGRQVNEKWCILPLAEQIHRQADRRDIKEKLDWIMLNRATDEELKRYSKSTDLIAKRLRLNKKYEY